MLLGSGSIVVLLQLIAGQWALLVWLDSGNDCPVDECTGFRYCQFARINIRRLVAGCVVDSTGTGHFGHRMLAIGCRGKGVLIDRRTCPFAWACSGCR